MTLGAQLARAHQGISCAHQEEELRIVTDAIVGLRLPGPVIELGAYKGGSTAKLSLACQSAGRRLYVCDTFTGLPDPGLDATHHFYSGRVKTYRAGDYAGTLGEVEANVNEYGALDACVFVPGLFADTLPHLDVTPALVFMDVDLVASARTALQYLWLRLQEGGLWFTHEAGVRTFIHGILDPAWWHTVMGQCPPLLIGAGTGFGPEAANLAYFERRA